MSLSLRTEGAGNAGCALHPRSRVQNVRVRAHTSIQGSGEHPTFPAQWFDGLSRAHPGVSGSSRLRRLAEFGTSARSGFAPPQNLTPTTEASGPHAFAVRFGIVRPARRCPLTGKPPCEHTSRPTPSRPPHPIPTFGDDGQRPFLRGQDGVSRKDDLPDGESEILPDGLICRIPSGGLKPEQCGQVKLGVTFSTRRPCVRRDDDDADALHHLATTNGSGLYPKR